MKTLNLQGVINSLSEAKASLSSLAAEAYHKGEHGVAKELWSQEDGITHRLSMVGKIEDNFARRQNKDENNGLISLDFVEEAK